MAKELNMTLEELGAVQGLIEYAVDEARRKAPIAVPYFQLLLRKFSDYTGIPTQVDMQ